MENKKVEIGSFTNDGLASGFPEFTKKDNEKIKEIFETDIERIKADFEAQLYRLDDYIKKNIGAIPRNEDFVNWFFDKKRFDEFGSNLPKITDDEIFENAKIYVKQLNNSLLKKSDNKSVIKSLKWISSEDKMKRLMAKLIDSQFINSNTSFDNFSLIFKDDDIRLINEKIIWLKIGRNKMPSKKSISDFINILMRENYIEKVQENIPRILSSSFSSILGELTFTHSNLANDDEFSEFITDLEKIIKAL